MTTATEPTLKVLAVLRRGKLDARDAAIVAAVARAWDHRHAVTLREIVDATGLTWGCLTYRVGGTPNYSRGRKGGTLIQQGWLTQDRYIARSLRPGPRLAGLNNGWPLEVVKGAAGKVEQAIDAMRKAG